MNIYHTIVAQSKLIQEITSGDFSINDLLDDDEVLNDLHKKYYDKQSLKYQQAVDRAYENILYYQGLLNEIYKLEG